MPDRITRANVEARVENLNRRFESRGSIVRWEAQMRNGHMTLDRLHVGDPIGTAQDHITAGTKSEIADFLRGAMLALDDASRKEGNDE